MKTLKSTLVLGIALVFLAAPGQLLAKKKIDLKYKLNQNDKYVTSSNLNQSIDMQNQGQDVNIQQQITTDVNTVIGQVASNSIQTTNTIKKMTLSQSVFGQKINYDSSDPKTYASGPGQKIGEALNKVIGKSYQVFIDELGNVTKYDLGDMADDNKVAGNLGSGDNFVVFPGHSIEVGDSWEAEIKPMKGSNMIFHVKYTLKKVSENEAVIGIEAKITANKAANSSLTLDGVQNGEATIDISTGWTTKLSVDQEVKMEVEQNGTSIPMTISGTIVKTSEKK